MAPDGRCKSFDARANGYVRSEGAGVVVLKPLSKALADGDPIYAVIRGSAVNQDGRSNGLMAPNPLAQEAVLREAYRQAGVAPGQVHYVEAHGTGTLLGDPIEAKALGTVLGFDRPAGQPCALGSVKTNVGPPRGRRRHRRLDQGGAGASASRDPAEPALREAQSAYSFRRASSPRADGARPMAHGVRPSTGGRQLVRLRRHQRACRSGRGAPGRLPERRMRNGDVGTHLLPLSARSPEALHSLARAYLELSRHPGSRGVGAGCLLHGQRAARSSRSSSRRDRQFADATDGEAGSFLAGRDTSRPVVWPQAFGAPAKACVSCFRGKAANGLAWGDGCWSRRQFSARSSNAATGRCDRTEIGRCSRNSRPPMQPSRG